MNWFKVPTSEDDHEVSSHADNDERDEDIKGAAPVRTGVSWSIGPMPSGNANNDRRGGRIKGAAPAPNGVSWSLGTPARRGGHIKDAAPADSLGPMPIRVAKNDRRGGHIKGAESDSEESSSEGSDGEEGENQSLTSSDPDTFADIASGVHTSTAGVDAVPTTLFSSSADVTKPTVDKVEKQGNKMIDLLQRTYDEFEERGKIIYDTWNANISHSGNNAVKKVGIERETVLRKVGEKRDETLRDLKEALDKHLKHALEQFKVWNKQLKKKNPASNTTPAVTPPAQASNSQNSQSGTAPAQPVTVSKAQNLQSGTAPAQPSTASNSPAQPVTAPAQPSTASNSPAQPVTAPAQPFQSGTAPAQPSTASNSPAQPVTAPAQPSTASNSPAQPVTAPAQPSQSGTAPAQPATPQAPTTPQPVTVSKAQNLQSGTAPAQPVTVSKAQNLQSGTAPAQPSQSGTAPAQPVTVSKAPAKEPSKLTAKHKVALASTVTTARVSQLGNSITSKRVAVTPKPPPTAEEIAEEIIKKDYILPRLKGTHIVDPVDNEWMEQKAVNAGGDFSDILKALKKALKIDDTSIGRGKKLLAFNDDKKVVLDSKSAVSVDVGEIVKAALAYPDLGDPNNSMTLGREMTIRIICTRLGVSVQSFFDAVFKGNFDLSTLLSRRVTVGDYIVMSDADFTSNYKEGLEKEPLTMDPAGNSWVIGNEFAEAARKLAAENHLLAPYLDLINPWTVPTAPTPPQTAEEIAEEIIKKDYILPRLQGAHIVDPVDNEWMEQKAVEYWKSEPASNASDIVTALEKALEINEKSIKHREKLLTFDDNKQIEFGAAVSVHVDAFTGAAFEGQRSIQTDILTTGREMTIRNICTRLGVSFQSLMEAAFDGKFKPGALKSRKRKPEDYDRMEDTDFAAKYKEDLEKEPLTMDPASGSWVIGKDFAAAARKLAKDGHLLAPYLDSIEPWTVPTAPTPAPTEDEDAQSDDSSVTILHQEVAQPETSSPDEVAQPDDSSDTIFPAEVAQSETSSPNEVAGDIFTRTFIAPRLSHTDVLDPLDAAYLQKLCSDAVSGSKVFHTIFARLTGGMNVGQNAMNAGVDLKGADPADSTKVVAIVKNGTRRDREISLTAKDLEDLSGISGGETNLSMEQEVKLRNICYLMHMKLEAVLDLLALSPDQLYSRSDQATIGYSPPTDLEADPYRKVRVLGTSAFSFRARRQKGPKIQPVYKVNQETSDALNEVAKEGHLASYIINKKLDS